MDLSESERLMLAKICAHDGAWNWYQLGRACLGLLNSPAEFTLKRLVDTGLIEEMPFEDEPLPRLHITNRGRRELEKAGRS